MWRQTFSDKLTRDLSDCLVGALSGGRVGVDCNYLKVATVNKGHYL